MATKIELEIRIRELERRLENDEQDMVEVCERIERLEGERDEYKKSSNDWARHFKSERTARIGAGAELEQLVADVKLGRERVIAERDALQERVQKLEQEDSITELIAYVCELEADKAISNPDESVELVRRMTLAMREADEMFETVGGSTRHHVRECLLPVLEKHGLGISLRKAIDNARSE